MWSRSLRHDRSSVGRLCRSILWVVRWHMLRGILRLRRVIVYWLGLCSDLGRRIRLLSEYRRHVVASLHILFTTTTNIFSYSAVFYKNNGFKLSNTNHRSNKTLTRTSGKGLLGYQPLVLIQDRTDRNYQR